MGLPQHRNNPNSETTGPIFTKFCTYIGLSSESNMEWVKIL